MEVRTEQPPLGRQDIALRYACALVPMVFFGGVLVVVLMRDSGKLPMVLVDAGLGVVGLVLIRWRRRRPWQVALATAALTAFSTTAAGPAWVAYVSLCTHRRWRQIVPVAIASLLLLAVQTTRNGFDQTTVISMAAGTAALGGLTVFGLLLRSRRDLAESQRVAALAAERAQLQLIEQAKLAERAQIAREMHDVLAHRISLLSMLAGGLAYRTDLSPEETRETALAIQQNAHASLNELRGVLGSLRSDGAPEAPQPTLDGLDALFADVRAAGQQVEVEVDIDRREQLPAQTGRHAYRIVQEAMTNARKHAPGSTVRAELAGRPGDGLRIRVSNPTVLGTTPAVGGRLGLVGLAERTRMAGGILSHTDRDGRFVLDAQLPWDADVL